MVVQVEVAKVFAIGYAETVGIVSVANTEVVVAVVVVDRVVAGVQGVAVVLVVLVLGLQY